MSSQQFLREQVTIKDAQIEDLVHKISPLNLRILCLSQKYNGEADKIQRKITKVQFSRPRGNPANQWPHRPMTPRVQVFYQTKESKESRLRQEKDLLKQTFDHSKAILTCQRQVFANAQFDLESQVRILKIQIHWKRLLLLIFSYYFPISIT